MKTCPYHLVRCFEHSILFTLLFVAALSFHVTSTAAELARSAVSELRSCNLSINFAGCGVTPVRQQCYEASKKIDQYLKLHNDVLRTTVHSWGKEGEDTLSVNAGTRQAYVQLLAFVHEVERDTASLLYGPAFRYACEQ